MRLLIILLICGSIFRLGISRFIYSGDLNNHIVWGQTITKHGGAGAYDREYQTVMQPTYPPLSLFAFTTSYWTYNQIYSLSSWLNKQFDFFPSKFIWWLEDQNTLPAFEKIIAIVSDMGIAVLIYRLVLRLKAKPALAAIAAGGYLFNPVVWYNSALWGQIETFPLFWTLLAIWLLDRGKLKLGHLSFAAALLSKQSSIIFIPFIGFLSLKRFGLRKTVEGILIELVAVYLAYLPFLKSLDILWPIKVYIHRLQVGSGSDYVTDHAFNLWVFSSHLQKIPDTLWQRMLGAGLFITGVILGLPKLFKQPNLKSLLSLMGQASLLSFLVLTRMHERYLAPALPFLAILSATSRWYWPIYVFVSLVHLLNMYHNWWVPTIPVWVSFISQWPVIYSLVIILVLSWIGWVVRYAYEKD